MVLVVLGVVLVVLEVVLVALGLVAPSWGSETVFGTDVRNRCSEQMFGTDSVRNDVPSQLRCRELLLRAAPTLCHGTV